MLRYFGQYIQFIGRTFYPLEARRVYGRLILDEAFEMGYKSILLFSLIPGFFGAVMVIQIAYNLTSPFIPLYVIALLVRNIGVLEVAPTIMAVVFAGKIGSHIAGTIGTMRITEQIDALEIMGINSTSYLVLPRVIAAMLMFPMLVVWAMTLSILGGYLAAIFLNITTHEEFIYGLRLEFQIYDVQFAFTKAVIFAFFVSTISSFTGYYTYGGAFEVGQASTRAFARSCYAILLGDYFLSELLL